MKKIAFVVLLAVASLNLAACSSTSAQSSGVAAANEKTTAAQVSEAGSLRK